METKMETKKVNGFIPTFITGANKGANVLVKVALPNILFAFAITRVLQLLEILPIIGKVLAPIMGIFQLPGEAAVPLVLSLVSFGGSLGVTASMLMSGDITGTHAYIMLPFIFLTGSILLWTGRVLSVTGIKPKDYVVIYIIAFVAACLSMFIMALLV